MRQIITSLSFIAISILVSSCSTLTDYSRDDKYVTFSGLPCVFNGVYVKGINNAANLGNKHQNCCPHCKGYPSKEGQTLHTKRGKPVFAIADMKLIEADNRSAKKRTGRKGNLDVSNYASQPYDDLKLVFQDTLGNEIIYYHLMSENPLVPGFGKGKCEIPDEWLTEQWKRLPENCGGIKKSTVKKGDLIGYVGSTGGEHRDNITGRVSGEHISMGIYVTSSDPRYEKRGLVVPSHNFTWENKATKDPLKYLLPINAD